MSDDFPPLTQREQILRDAAVQAQSEIERLRCIIAAALERVELLDGGEKLDRLRQRIAETSHAYNTGTVDVDDPGGDHRSLCVTESTSRPTPVHHVELTWDGDDSPPSVKLTCPPTGCEPPGHCTECGRNRGDANPCDLCPTDDDPCCAKDWADNDQAYVEGTVTLPVEIGWEGSPDEGPTLSIVESLVLVLTDEAVEAAARTLARAFDYEGVFVSDTSEMHNRAFWRRLAQDSFAAARTHPA